MTAPACTQWDGITHAGPATTAGTPQSKPRYTVRWGQCCRGAPINTCQPGPNSNTGRWCGVCTGWHTCFHLFRPACQGVCVLPSSISARELEPPCHQKSHGNLYVPSRFAWGLANQQVVVLYTSVWVWGGAGRMEGEGGRPREGKVRGSCSPAPRATAPPIPSVRVTQAAHPQPVDCCTQ